MSLSPANLVALREGAAARNRGRCCYCASYVTPVDAGVVDFFQPLERGGASSADNALFACARCSANKGGYWHAVDAPHVRLLHPFNDTLAEHLRTADDGILVPLSAEGAFFIELLRLNRESLIVQRRALHLVERAREITMELQRRIEAAR